jgi:hypothetical protein
VPGCYPDGVRGILVVLHLIAAAAAVLFIGLALIYVVLAGWALWERQIAAFAAMFVLGAFSGYVAIRVLIGLGDSVIRWRRQCLAERDLPRATVVSR